MTKGPEQYLESDAATSRVLAHARLLLKLTQRFEAIAPPGLRDAAQVANYKSGKVVIHADTGAVAAKIRQMSQRLCSELSKFGAECSDIDVKVHPRHIQYQATSSTQKPLSAKTFGLLRSTAENLPKGPLQEALNKLMERAAKQE